MRRDTGPGRRSSRTWGRSPSLRVEGEGVYEIPVGPVHAGIIEPGHFRFSVVGETILRMKAGPGSSTEESRSSSKGVGPADGDRAGRAHQRGHRRRACHRLRDGGGGRRAESTVVEEAASCERSCSSWNACTTTSPTSVRCANDVGYGIVQRPRVPAPGDLAPAQQADDRPPAAARRNHGSAEPGLSLPDPEGNRGVRSRGDGRAGRPGRCQLDRALIGSPAPPSSAATHAIEIGTLGYVARAGVDDRRPPRSPVRRPGGPVLGRGNEPAGTC